MRSRASCLLLIALGLTAWTEDLRAGTLVAPLPKENPSSFRQVVFPIALRYRAEIREKIKTAPQDHLGLLPLGSELDKPDSLLSRNQVTFPRVLSSADYRYLMMSLQP